MEAFEAATTTSPDDFQAAYTVKGYGLPFAGHSDNHAG
jgi:pyruvate dehydrogenase E1 component